MAVPPRLGQHLWNAEPLVSVPVVAAIPTIGMSRHLRPLVEGLVEDPGVDEVLLIRNEDVVLDVPHHAKVVEVYIGEKSISVWWNWAIRYCAVDAARLALLNDDIWFTSPWAVSDAVRLFDVHPDMAVCGFNYEEAATGVRWCKGSYRDHGVSGAAFMVDSARCPLVDEQFRWWGTEDDLFMQVANQDDRMGVAMELTFGHDASTTAAVTEWTYTAREEDRQRFVAKYGSAW